MKVRELMTKQVVSASPEMSLRDAAALLVEHDISGLPVVLGSEVVGVLSEEDIVRKASAGAPGQASLFSWLFEPDMSERKVSAQTVAEAMTAPALTIEATRPVYEAARRMISESVNRLPVLEHGKLVGILTRADIVRAFARADGELTREIHDDILRRTFWVQPGSVTVKVDQGRVSLRGEVETEADVEMLPIFVSRVPGVVSVRANLRARTRVA